MTDLGKQLFDTGVALNQAHAEMLRTAEIEHRVAYLIWSDGLDSSLLLGVCGTRERADQEAEDLGHALNQVLRIEIRRVHC